MSTQPSFKYGKLLLLFLNLLLEERIKQLADRLTDAHFKNSQLQEHVEYLNKQLNDRESSFRNSK